MRGLLLALLLAAGSARANPVDTFGFGARGGAMAGAQTAATRDGGANYYNPAALAIADHIEIDLGYQLATPRLRLNGLSQEVDQSRGLQAALTAPGVLLGHRFALGAAVFLPDERVARVRTHPSQRPRWALYDNRPQRIFLASHLALKVTDRLWIGAGIAYMSRTRGQVDLEGRVGFPDAEDSELEVAVDVDLQTIRYPQAGVLVRLAPWLDLGVTYRHRFVARFDQRLRIDGDVGARGQDPPIVDDGFFVLHSVALDLFQPAQVATGVAARLTRRLLLAADVTWQRWSQYQNPAAKIELDLDLKDLNDLVELPVRPPLPEAHFHDVLVPRIGVEWSHPGPRLSWHVRGGWSYEPSPALPQTHETNFVDNDKHTFALGGGLDLARITDVLPRPFSLDAYLALTWLPAREHHKVSPVDPVGDYVSRGTVIAGGLSGRFRF